MRPSDSIIPKVWYILRDKGPMPPRLVLKELDAQHILWRPELKGNTRGTRFATLLAGATKGKAALLWKDGHDYGPVEGYSGGARPKPQSKAPTASGLQEWKPRPKPTSTTFLFTASEAAQSIQRVEVAAELELEGRRHILLKVLG